MLTSILTSQPFLITVGCIVPYYLFYQLILWPYLLSPLRRVPGPPLGDPLFGRALDIVRRAPGIPHKEWVSEYGPVVRVVGPIGIERVIFMRPEALQKILVSSWEDYPRPTYLRHILGLVAGYGLLTVTGETHKQMRKAMNPAFSIPNLMAQTDMYYETINKLVRILRESIHAQEQTEPGKGAVLLMYDWLGKATLDIISRTAFGYDPNSLQDPHNELATAYEDMIALQSGPNLAKITLVMNVPFGPRLLASEWLYRNRQILSRIPGLKEIPTLISSLRTIRKISSQMLKEKVRETNAVGVGDVETKKDVMSLLVRARAEWERSNSNTRQGEKEEDVRVGYGMDDKAMMDQVLTFLGAGHETTASGLAWTLWLLATHPDAQQKLREEVTPVFAPHESRPDYRTLMKDLPWLDGVVMESLRLYPPVPLTVRRAEKTDWIDGVQVPKGALLVIAIRAINTWKETWGEDADEFNPSRWRSLPPTVHPTFSFQSFITGPHACIGKTMAIVEMKAVLGALVANFRFEPAHEGQKPQPDAAITMKPTDRMPLRVRAI